MKKFILLSLTLILAACSAGAGIDSDKNLTKWNDANITHYRYSLVIGCFCPFSDDMPLTIEVNEGEAVLITRADGTPVNPLDLSYEFYESYSTIDRIFLELEAEVAGGADEVTVEYDPTYGFPINIDIDQIKDAMDDELSLHISNFEVLE